MKSKINSMDEASSKIASTPVSKTQYVLDRLREEIAAGLALPGTSLRQIDIATRYGVSPTPVREALRLLEAEGTIAYSPHRGATVRELSPMHAEDIYRLRAEVEGLATEVAVERMTESSLRNILSIHRELASLSSSDGKDRSILNKRLHFTIYRAGSETIANQAENLWDLFPPQVTIWSDKDTATALLSDHDSLIESLIARNAKLARECLSKHILHAFELRQAL